MLNVFEEKYPNCKGNREIYVNLTMTNMQMYFFNVESVAELGSPTYNGE